MPKTKSLRFTAETDSWPVISLEKEFDAEVDSKPVLFHKTVNGSGEEDKVNKIRVSWMELTEISWISELIENAAVRSQGHKNSVNEEKDDLGSGSAGHSNASNNGVYVSPCDGDYCQTPNVVDIATDAGRELHIVNPELDNVEWVKKFIGDIVRFSANFPEFLTFYFSD